MAPLVTKDNFREMLEIYKKHSKMHGLIRNIEKKHMVEKLDHEMRKLFPQPKPEKPKPHPVVVVKVEHQPVQPEQKPEKLKVIRNHREVFYDDLPKRLQLLWDKNRDDYKEIRSLHEKLKLMEKATAKDREPICLRMISLEEEIRKRWSEIDNWNPVPDELKIDHKRISSNRKYISTWLDRLDNGCPDKDMAVANLQERYDEMWINHIDISDKILNELSKHGVKVHGIGATGTDV